MVITTRLQLMDELFQLHARCNDDLAAACAKGCAACCTDRVMITTLEGLTLRQALQQSGPADWRLRLQRASRSKPFRWQRTLNQWAAQCIADEDAAEEEALGPVTGSCLFLTEGFCPIYAARPLVCRAMLSGVRCSAGGAAVMPAAVEVLNTVLLQYLEAVDRPGLSGNLIDILLFLDDDQNRRAYRAGRIAAVAEGLLVNQPLPALMVPPDQHQRLRPVIARIQEIIRRLAAGSPAR